MFKSVLYFNDYSIIVLMTELTTTSAIRTNDAGGNAKTAKNRVASHPYQIRKVVTRGVFGTYNLYLNPLSSLKIAHS